MRAQLFLENILNCRPMQFAASPLGMCAGAPTGTGTRLSFRKAESFVRPCWAMPPLPLFYFLAFFIFLSPEVLCASGESQSFRDEHGNMFMHGAEIGRQDWRLDQSQTSLSVPSPEGTGQFLCFPPPPLAIGASTPAISTTSPAADVSKCPTTARSSTSTTFPAGSVSTCPTTACDSAVALLAPLAASHVSSCPAALSVDHFPPLFAAGAVPSIPPLSSDVAVALLAPLAAPHASSCPAALFDDLFPPVLAASFTASCPVALVVDSFPPLIAAGVVPLNGLFERPLPPPAVDLSTSGSLSLAPLATSQLLGHYVTPSTAVATIDANAFRLKLAPVLAASPKECTEWRSANLPGLAQVEVSASVLAAVEPSSSSSIASPLLLAPASPTSVALSANLPSSPLCIAAASPPSLALAAHHPSSPLCVAAASPLSVALAANPPSSPLWLAAASPPSLALAAHHASSLPFLAAASPLSVALAANLPSSPLCIAAASPPSLTLSASPPSVARTQSHSSSIFPPSLGASFSYSISRARSTVHWSPTPLNSFMKVYVSTVHERQVTFVLKPALVILSRMATYRSVVSARQLSILLSPARVILPRKEFYRAVVSARQLSLALTPARVILDSRQEYVSTVHERQVSYVLKAMEVYQSAVRERQVSIVLTPVRVILPRKETYRSVVSARQLSLALAPARVIFERKEGYFSVVKSRQVSHIQTPAWVTPVPKLPPPTPTTQPARHTRFTLPPLTIMPTNIPVASGAEERPRSPDVDDPRAIMTFEVLSTMLRVAVVVAGVVYIVHLRRENSALKSMQRAAQRSLFFASLRARQSGVRAAHARAKRIYRGLRAVARKPLNDDVPELLNKIPASLPSRRARRARPISARRSAAVAKALAASSTKPARPVSASRQTGRQSVDAVVSKAALLVVPTSRHTDNGVASL